MTLPLKEIWVRYVEWVSRNPQTTSEIESSVKWISYFLAGKINYPNMIIIRPWCEVTNQKPWFVAEVVITKNKLNNYILVVGNPKFSNVKKENGLKT